MAESGVPPEQAPKVEQPTRSQNASRQNPQLQPAAYRSPVPGVPRPPYLRPIDETAVSVSDKRSLEEMKRLTWQEAVRAIVTGCFLLLLAVMIGFSGCAARSANKDVWAQTEKMLQIILPALTGLLGSSLGFYFGSREREHHDRIAPRK